MKNFVSQESTNDCGVACLAMILKQFGKNISADRLRGEVKLDKDGTSAYEIIRVSKKHGINAEAYKNYDISKSQNFPLIAHVVRNKLQHFVVVLGIRKNKVLVADPAKGVMEVLIKDFAKIYTGIAIIFKNNVLSVKDAFKNKSILAFIVGIILFISLLNVLCSYLLSFIINNINNNKIVAIILCFLFLGIIKELASYVKDKIVLKFKIMVDKIITIPTIRKIINLPHSFYQNNGSGELISKVNDLSYVKNMIFSVVEVLFVNVIILFTSYVFVFVIDYKLLLINIFTSFLLIYINKKFHDKNLSKTYDLQIKTEELNGKISDVITCISSVKNLSKEKYFSDELTKRYTLFLNDYKSLSHSYFKKDLIFKILIFVINVFLICTFVFNRSSPTMILFIMYIQSIIFDCLSEICLVQPSYTNYKSACKRINNIYKIDEIKESSENTKITNILINNLNYKYKNKIVINNLSLSISKGDFIMITGKTGVGKSTLFKLLTKQRKCYKNKIFINGVDINDYDESDIRRGITYVDQKTRLFNDSIKENITLGKNLNLKYNFKKIINDMLKKNFIDYNYIIDNTNSNLSGGQLQLIMIAQALNNNASVIIFDETTSQLDEETERKVLHAIKKDYADKTIILISHRKSNKDLFNKVIEFRSDKEKN